MASDSAGVLRTPALAGVLLFFMLVASLSPVLQTELLSVQRSQYLSVRSSTSNLIDVPTWMVGDRWVFDATVDVGPALADTALNDPSVNVDLLTGDTTHVIQDIRTEDVGGVNTLIYEMNGFAHYEGSIFIPSDIAEELAGQWVPFDINGNLEADYVISRWVRVSDLATIYQTQTVDVEVTGIPILGTFDVGLITLEETHTPPVEKYDFPLDVGNNWWMNYSTYTVWSGQSSTFPLPDPATYDYNDKFEVTQTGDPSVSYGCSNSIRVQQVNMSSGEERGFEWYCEDARYFAWYHGDVLLGMVQDLKLKEYDPEARSQGSGWNIDLPFTAYPPGFDVNVSITGGSEGELRFEADGWSTDFTSEGFWQYSFTLNNTADDSPTEYDVGTHGLIVWDGAEKLGVTTLIIDPNAEGIDLVARSSGVIVSRLRGTELVTMNSITGYSAHPGDILTVSLPVQNRGISRSVATMMEINGPAGQSDHAIPSLSAYQEHRVILEWEVPSDAQYGYVMFSFLADPGDLNDEVDETNNAGTTPLIRIGAAPLAVTYPVSTIYTFENVTIDGSQSSDPDGGDVTCEFVIRTADGLGNTWYQTRSSDECLLTYFWSDDGDYLVAMNVIDDEGDVTTLEVIVEVLNQAPFIGIWADRSEVQIGESFTVNAENSGDVDSITPPDVADVEVSWPDSSCVEGAYKLNCTVTPDLEGPWTVTAVATDDDGAQTTATLTIDVMNIMPLVVDIGATSDGTPLSIDDRSFWTVNEDEEVELHGVASDSSNDVEDLHWTWSSLTMGGSEVAWQREDNGENSEIEVVWSLAGEYTVQANVLDDDLSRSPEALRWIRVVNVPPNVAEIVAPAAFGEGMLLSLTGSATDTTSDIAGLMICWDIDPAANSDSLGSSDDDCDIEGDELMHSWDSAGDYTIIYHATDDDGARGVAEVLITVLNQPPVARIDVSAEQILVGQSVTFDASQSTDSAADRETLTYLWDMDTNVDSDGDGISDNDIDHRGSNVTAKFLEAGTFTILLTVKDEDGCESSRCTQELVIEVESRTGGAFAQVLDDVGLSLEALGLIGLLFVLLMILVFTRRGGEPQSKNMQENWDAQLLGAATNMPPMPGAAPMTAAFSFDSQAEAEVTHSNAPPLPETGLPKGWTMEQWTYYGAAWTEQQQTASMGGVAMIEPVSEFDELQPTQPGIGEAMDLLSDSQPKSPATEILDLFDDDELDL